MEHKHHEHDSHKNILAAFLLNLFFSIVEFIGGIFTNSISILSDAFHDFGDAISLLISVICEKKSKKNATEKYTFGYIRYSVLGALITSIILTIGCVTILFNCVPKLFAPQEVNYDGMLIIAIVGVFVNGIAAMKTHHSHTLNEKAVSLHMLEDLLGWIAVLIGSVVIKFTRLYIIDPILSILTTIYILVHIVRNINEIGKLFLVKSPDSYNEEILKTSIKDLDEVKDVHHIHAWSLDSNNHFMTMHVVLTHELTFDKLHLLKHKIKEIVTHKLDITHITIEFEKNGEHCKEETCKINKVSGHSHTH